MSVNQEIKGKIVAAGLKQWQVAEAMGMSEYTLSRWMRHELTEEQREKVCAAVERIKRGDHRAR